jgi:hypothetical protein
MAVTFDPQTLSITVDLSLDEYTAAAGVDIRAERAGILGLNLADLAAGDRSKFLEFRHEHAHFSSFMATGLSDLQGVISDYLYVMLYRIVTVESKETGILRVPVIRDTVDSAALGSRLSRAYSAWNQVNALRALLFGFGTRMPLLELLDRSVQSRFWEDYYDDKYRPIILRYYRLLELLATYDPTVSTSLYGDPRPLVTVGDGQSRPLSVRSVMEAYAVSVELMATRVVAMTTDQTFYGSPIVRNPIPMYMTAIEYVLDRLVPDVALDEFLTLSYRNRPTVMPLGACYLMLALTYAAMQVPVLQLQDGEVIMSGTLGTLSVSHRFRAIVEAIAEGDLAFPSDNPKNLPERNHRLIEWLKSCHQRLGDSDGMQIYEYVRDQVNQDDSFKGRGMAEQSLIDLSWAGRANFMEEPVEYVYDAGLFAERYPLQPRFIRTNDHKCIMTATEANRMYHYFGDRAVPILEASVFGSQWEYAWGKLSEVSPDDRLSTIQNVFVYTKLRFGDSADGGEIEVPSFELLQH